MGLVAPMLLQQFLQGWLQQYIRGHAKGTVHTPFPLCLQSDSGLHLLHEQGWLQPCRVCRGLGRHVWQGGWVSVREPLLLSRSPARHSPCTGPGLQQRSPVKGEQGRQGSGGVVSKDTTVSPVRCTTGCGSGFSGAGGRQRKRGTSRLKCQVPATSQGKEPHVNNQLLSM